METIASNSLQHNAVLLILQIAFILISTWISAFISSKIRIPEVILYLLLGIVFGPFLLGSIPVFHVLPEGLFPLKHTNAPISQELFSLSAMASIILLFSSGLQSDIELFKKYILKGSFVGFSGIILSFAGGYFVSRFFLPELSVIHPIHLFFATISTATSVSISSTILSDNKMISSPEGVTILSAAVIDDVIGVILLSIVLGLSHLLGEDAAHSKSFLSIILSISFKAVFIWLFFTFIGIIFSKQVGKMLKKLCDPTMIALFALALSFLLGYVFEYFNLSVIVGAFIVGLTLSNTDISYLIQERVYPIFKFFVPIFFFVSGMYINISVLFNGEVLLLGIVFSLIGIVTKFFGAAIPSFFLGFNSIGATRVGFGMLPRGEVSLIIAGLGRASGILDDFLFGSVLIMIFISSVVAPILFDKVLKIQRKGTRKDIQETMVSTRFVFERIKLTKLILSELIQVFQADGFFINSTRRKNNTMIHIRKNESFITLHYKNDTTLLFTSEPRDKHIIQTAIQESVSNIAETTSLIQDTIRSRIMKETVVSLPNKDKQSNIKQHRGIQLKQFMSKTRLCLDLKSNNKKDVIAELVFYLKKDAKLDQKQMEHFLEEVYEREEVMSTGMEYGIAIPHVRSNVIDEISIVIGIKKEGIDFNALDNQNSTIFVLIASPNEGPHLEVLTKISTLLSTKDFRTQLLKAETTDALFDVFSQ